MGRSETLHVLIPEEAGVSLSDYERNVSAILDIAAFAYGLESGDSDFKLRGISRENVRVVSGKYGSPFELLVEFLNTPPAAAVSIAALLPAVGKLLERLVAIRMNWYQGSIYRNQSRAASAPAGTIDFVEKGATPNVPIAYSMSPVPELTSYQESPTPELASVSLFEERVADVEAAAEALEEPVRSQIQRTLDKARVDHGAGRKTKSVRVVESIHYLAERQARIVDDPSAENVAPPKVLKPKSKKGGGKANKSGTAGKTGKRDRK